MFARVTVVQTSTDKLDEGAATFKEKVLPTAKDQPGYQGAAFFADRSSGKAMGFTLWESEEARSKAGEALVQARQAALDVMGASAPPVDEYEVVVSDFKS